jgi:hypothetical protein
VIYQLVQLAAHAEQAPQDPRGSNHSLDQGLTASLVSILRRTDVRGIAHDYERGDPKPLDTLLGDVENILPELSDLLSHRFFFHSGPMQRLAEIELTPQLDE